MSDEMILYSTLAEHYFDIEAAGRDMRGEIESLRGALRRREARDIIDLGCGSGEHVDALRKHRFRVEGLDIAPEMIEVARNRFPDCIFHQGDMRDFHGDRIYDAAVCLFGSFDYILENEDVEKSLKNIRELLRPEGLFILEVWNAVPLYKITRRALTPVVEVRSQGRVIGRDRGFVLMQPRPTLVQVNYVYHMGGRELSDRHIMRAYEVDEITDFAEEAGFTVETVASGLDGLEYSPRRNRIVLFLRSS